MAALLGVSESTISRELTRNEGKKGYRPKQAQIKADNRKIQAAKALNMTTEIPGFDCFFTGGPLF